jgi:hypothetical protein
MFAPESERYLWMARARFRAVLDALRRYFISRAAAYLEFAGTRYETSEAGSGAPLEDRSRQVRQLIKQALDAPTPEGLVRFLTFTTSFRRLGVWNARMAYIQRPGARIIASEYEWKTVGRYVLPDAVPIMILWPFSPIRFVYEFEDTGPPIDRESMNDPFAVRGTLEPRVLSVLEASLKSQKSFKIKIEYQRQGSGKAGSAAAHGLTPAGQKIEGSWDHGQRIGEFAEQNGEIQVHSIGPGFPTYRVIVNDRLDDNERFVTIAHELGHIFLGHLGQCTSRSGKDEESGWPDRRSLGKNEKEVEAETVAYLVASRAGIVPASAQYLKTYATRADMSRVDVDLVVRSAARIERMCKIRYGSMEFKPPANSASDRGVGETV